MHQYKLTFFSVQQQSNLLINTHVHTGILHIIVLVIMYLLWPALSSLSDRPQNKKLYCWAGGPRPCDSSSRFHCLPLKHKACRWSGTRPLGDNFRNWFYRKDFSLNGHNIQSNSSNILVQKPTCQRCACSWQWCWCFLVATMWTTTTCAYPYRPWSNTKNNYKK